MPCVCHAERSARFWSQSIDCCSASSARPGSVRDHLFRDHSVFGRRKVRHDLDRLERGEVSEPESKINPIREENGVATLFRSTRIDQFDSSDSRNRCGGSNSISARLREYSSEHCSSAALGGERDMIIIGAKASDQIRVQEFMVGRAATEPSRLIAMFDRTAFGRERRSESHLNTGEPR